MHRPMNVKKPADCFETLLYFNECIAIQNIISLTQNCFYLKAASLGDPTVVLRLTHWHTQPAVRRAEPSMPLLLILVLCQ
jgi:hypothetical protein